MCKPILTLVLAVFVILINACTKDATDHSDQGQIASLTIDWTNRGEGVGIPAEYTITVGEYSVILSGPVNTIENLFSPGRYNLYAYNTPQGISVNGTTASANYSVHGGIGWLFTGKEYITIDRDTDHSVSIVMRQQVRQLTLELEITGDAADRLTGVDGTLSGVAKEINIANGIPTGNLSAPACEFSKSDGQFVSSLRLLGVDGDTQILSLTLCFLDDNPSTYTVTSDLSGLLSGFNDDKITPLTLSSILTVTPTQSGFSTAVSNWMLGETTSGVAD